MDNYLLSCIRIVAVVSIFVLVIAGPITSFAQSATESQFALTGYTLSTSPSVISPGQEVVITGEWYGGIAPYNATLYEGQSASCSSDTTPESTVAGTPGGTIEIGSPVLVYGAVFYGTPNATEYYCIKVKDAGSQVAQASYGAVKVLVVPNTTEYTTTVFQVPNVTTTFTEVGLPKGSNFSVMMDGRMKRVPVSATDTISFSTGPQEAFSYGLFAVSYNGVGYSESTSARPKAGGSIIITYSSKAVASSTTVYATSVTAASTTMPPSSSASTTVMQGGTPNGGGFASGIVNWLRHLFGSL